MTFGFDASLRRLGEAVAVHLRPGLPGIGALPECRARPAAVEEVRAAHALPARCPHHVRIARVELDIDETGLVAHELGERPGLAAVGALVEPALLVRSPDVSERRDVHDVCVARIHDDAADRLCLGEAHELPALPAIGGLVHAAARGDGVARVLLARAKVEHVAVARRDGEVAVRGGALVVENGAEGRAGVRRLPDAARRGHDVERLRWRGEALDVGDASAHVRRPDRAPAEGGDEGGVELLGAGSARGKHRTGERYAEQRDEPGRTSHGPVGEREGTTVRLRLSLGQC
jgi:hypothetical protein